jgi:hypothetical protein
MKVAIVDKRKKAVPFVFPVIPWRKRYELSESQKLVNSLQDGAERAIGGTRGKYRKYSVYCRVCIDPLQYHRIRRNIRRDIEKAMPDLHSIKIDPDGRWGVVITLALIGTRYQHGR